MSKEDYIRAILIDRFNEDELKILCAELKVEWEDLDPGTKKIKVLSLLDFLRRRDRLEEMVQWLVNHRSDINLSDIKELDFDNDKSVKQLRDEGPPPSQIFPKRLYGLAGVFFLLVLGATTYFVYNTINRSERAPLSPTKAPIVESKPQETKDASERLTVEAILAEETVEAEATQAAVDEMLQETKIAEVFSEEATKAAEAQETAMAEEATAEAAVVEATQTAEENRCIILDSVDSAEKADEWWDFEEKIDLDTWVMNYFSSRAQTIEGNYSLQIDYHTTEDYQFVGYRLPEPYQDLSTFSSIELYVFGQVEILFKLEGFKILNATESERPPEYEFEQVKLNQPTDWSPLKFSISQDISPVDKSRVNQLLFFIEPKNPGSIGTIYFDELKLCK